MSTATLPAEMTAPKKRPRGVLPKPPSERGVGARVGGKYDDRTHYVPVTHNLRTWRDRARVDQRRLAAITAEVAAAEVAAARVEGREPRWEKGLSSYTINRYENGFHSPLPDNANLLAEALNVALKAQGVEVRLVGEDLRVSGPRGLGEHLRSIMGRVRPTDFWRRLGIDPRRGPGLLDGSLHWTADELGAVGVAFPQADTFDLLRDTLVQQARERRALPAPRAWAVRDTAHPHYTPSKPRPRARRGRDAAQDAPA